MNTSEKWIAVSGGFDPLHIGHVRLFKAARALGDRLVVIVNNDNWLRAKKGFVFMPQHERVEIIEQFSFVDRVALTDHKPNDTDMSVCRALEEIRPAVFANGGDRGSKNTPESTLCEKLNIEPIYGIGVGGKVQSSSWMVNGAAEAIKTCERPWGSFKNHHSMPGVHLKTLHVAGGAKLSLQRHKNRSETWVLVSGDAQAVFGNSVDDLSITDLKVNEPYYVPAGTIHRLTSKNGGVLVEISYGKFDEEDIERFEDEYGRLK